MISRYFVFHPNCIKLCKTNFVGKSSRCVYVIPRRCEFYPRVVRIEKLGSSSEKYMTKKFVSAIFGSLTPCSYARFTCSRANTVKPFPGVSPVDGLILFVSNTFYSLTRLSCVPMLTLTSDT